MTIKRYAGDKLVGLSSDTKPTNLPDGATFYETDTLSSYLRVGGSWSALSSGGGGGTSIEASNTAPAEATVGDLWFNTDDAAMYFYYDDGVSNNWVAISGPTGPAGVDGADGADGLDAPSVGKAIAFSIVFGYG